MPSTLRRLVHRSAWLMLGAAIGLALVLLGVTVVQSVLREAPVWLVAVVTVLAGAALGLVPGARELEVTAARSMLDTGAELVVPRRTRLVHRAQTAAWVLFHQVAGLLVAAAIFAGVPYAVLVAVEAFTGSTIGSTLPAPSSAAEAVVRVVVSAAVGLGLALVAWPTGMLAARLAGRALGPTAHDRLEVALDRAGREAEHTRLARELHDGIGHALTIISVQAAAGRRVAGRDPALVGEALAAIEDTARGALTELDELLAVLREDRDGGGSDGRPTAGSRADLATVVDLDGIVAAHRRAGLEVEAAVDAPPALPALLRRTVDRIVAEALANAHRHGGAGPVRLVVGHTDEEVRVEVTNPLPGGAGWSRPWRERAGGRSGGRGLAGVRERVSLFGGTVFAGPDGDRWTVRVTLPRLAPGTTPEEDR
ncbi:sensor histidine kinase [Antribacter gilvus]|uniref:sensor histidine kinase n=1 Tax=Antribacter gilvus TaxID=2304675 RepID=UPI000F77F096|nr:histidine kinase [Antribacter gilvus]